MPRASFGGAQDLSQVFASFYSQYESRLETNALQAGRLAEDQQTAADNDMIDRWQQGDVTDQEFLKYAAGRVSATADDPTRNAYWKKVQRDTQKSILTTNISDTAEGLVNQVEAGTKTWNDLLAFYKNAQKSLKPSDPLYNDLSKQIEKVNDTIRTNKVSAGFERVQYQFEANQISGRDAGAQLRKMAEQYRTNDPARYYQILQQALSLEKYGGFYSSGSGGSGGGGGGGGGSGRGASAKPLNQLIDALQGMRDRIGSLSEQFDKGVKVGSITVENADGSLSTQEVLLQNPDGTPSAQMKSLDGQMLETLDRLEQTYIDKGDRSAAGGVANYRMGYITDHIQPRNTIGPQQQAASLLKTGLSIVEQAANSDDPVLAWSQVQQWASKVGDWEARLNKTVTQTPSKHQFTGAQVSANPELAAAQLTTAIKANPLEGQTTGDFKSQVAGLREFANAVASGDAAKATAALEGIAPNQTGVSDTAKRVSAAIDLVTGIPAGKYVRAYVPGEGLVYAPVAPTYSTEIGPDGQPQTVLRSIPVRPNGKPIYDASKGESLVDVMVQIDGRAQMVKAVAQPSYFVNGQAVSTSEYQKAVRDSQTPTKGQSAPKLQQYRSMLIPGQDGSAPQNWIYDEGQGLWFKNQISKYGGVPLPFVGDNAQLAQKVADQLGIDPKGTSYYNAPAEAARTKAHDAWGGGHPQGWYTKAQDTARSEFQRQARGQSADQFRAARSQLGGFADSPVVSQALKLFGSQLGIRSFDAPQQQTVSSLAGHSLPSLSTLGGTAFVPKITLPKMTPVVAPNITSWSMLGLPSISDLGLDAQAPTTTRITTGRYAGKTVPLR